MGQTSSQMQFNTLYDEEDERDKIVNNKENEKEYTELVIVDIRKKMPTVLNCKENGYSSVYAICFALQYEYRKLNISFIPSVYFMTYNVCKNDDGKCSIRNAFKSLTENGVCSESLCPYNSENIPSEDCFEEAKKMKTVVYEKLEKNEQLKTLIINILDNNSPVIFSYNFYYTFLNPKNNIINGPIEDDKLLGIHSAVICGYEKDYFIVNNNIGSDWGESGYVWIHKDFVLSGDDFWIMNKITKKDVNKYIKRQFGKKKIIKDSSEDTYYSD